MRKREREREKESEREKEREGEREREKDREAGGTDGVDGYVRSARQVKRSSHRIGIPETRT